MCTGKFNAIGHHLDLLLRCALCIEYVMHSLWHDFVIQEIRHNRNRLIFI